jgi:Protein of Unknown function (DUF2784)
MVAYHALADLVVIFHAAYVGFVIIGFVLILIGAGLGWNWTRNFRFRLVHLAAIAAVCVEAVVGAVCPLTALENFLRQKGGETTYPGAFIGYWAHNLIFYDFPAWVFTVSYFAFAMLVVAAFVLAPPRAPRRRVRGGGGHRP